VLEDGVEVSPAIGSDLGFWAGRPSRSSI